MIFVLFGVTGKVGVATKKIFMDRGFRPLRKKYFILDPKRSDPATLDGDIVTREELEKCAIRYEVSGRMIGFQFEDIADGGNGKSNVYMSLSTLDKNILHQLREAYGPMVKVVYSCIDLKTLIKITKARPLSHSDIRQRIEMGMQLQEFYAENMKYFDAVAIYSESNPHFSMQSLTRQYHQLIDKALEEQRLLNNNVFVDLPFQGPNGYAFASYSHNDRAIVTPLLYGLQRFKCKVWYDKALDENRERNLLWENILQDKVTNCSHFIIFRSQHSVKANWVWQEFDWAEKLKKPVTMVRLDDSKFGKSDFDKYERIQSPSLSDDPDLTEHIHREHHRQWLCKALDVTLQPSTVLEL